MPSTKTYDLGYLRLDLPDSWTQEIGSPSVDTARARFSARVADGAGDSSITVVREPLLAGETLRAHADRTLLRLTKAGALFQFVESQARVVGGREAFSKRVRFGIAPRVEQTLVTVDLANDPNRNATILTCAAPIEKAEQTALVFEQVLGTIRFAAAPAP
jgi:hypothetical protein